MVLQQFLPYINTLEFSENSLNLKLLLTKDSDNLLCSYGHTTDILVMKLLQ